MAIPTVEDIVTQMKREIARDVLELVVPVNVGSFSELHDYVDANEYGGFCEDGDAGITDTLIAHFGGRDEDEGMPDEVINFMNECQSRIDAWLSAGGLEQRIENDHWGEIFTPVAFGDLLQDYKALKWALDNIRSCHPNSTIEDLREIARLAYVNANY